MSRIDKIVSLFEYDEGRKWDPGQVEFARNKWDELKPEDRKFLENLSEEDLESICIGEVRAVDGVDHHFFGGKWDRTPEEVDSFLNLIWEWME